MLACSDLQTDMTSLGSVDVGMESVCSSAMDVTGINSPNEVSMKSITSPTASVQDLTSIGTNECEEAETSSSTLEQALEAYVRYQMKFRVNNNMINF